MNFVTKIQYFTKQTSKKLKKTSNKMSFRKQN